MKTRLLSVAALLVLTTGLSFAHDPSKHKGKPVQGEVVSSAADRFEIKTAAGVVPVTFSSKTKVEHGDATVDRTHVTKGVHVSVFGTKLPSGEMVAREVLIGTGSGHTEHGATKQASPERSKSKQSSSEAHKH